MKAYMKRLLKETSDLQVKLYDLRNMVESETFEEKVEDAWQRELLIRQQEVMNQYYAILKKRLELEGIV